MYIVVYDPVNNAVVMEKKDQDLLWVPTLNATLTEYDKIKNDIKTMFKNSDKIICKRVARYDNWLVYTLRNLTKIQTNNNFYLVSLKEIYFDDVKILSIKTIYNFYTHRCVNFLRGVYDAHTKYKTDINITDKLTKMEKLKEIYARHIKNQLVHRNFILPDKYENKHILIQLIATFLNYFMYFRFCYIFKQHMSALNYLFNNFERGDLNYIQIENIKAINDRVSNIESIINSCKVIPGLTNNITITEQLSDSINTLKDYDNTELITELYYLEGGILDKQHDKLVRPLNTNDTYIELQANLNIIEENLKNQIAEYTNRITTFDNTTKLIYSNLSSIEKNLMHIIKNKLKDIELSTLSITDTSDYDTIVRLENSYDEFVQQQQYKLYKYNVHSYNNVIDAIVHYTEIINEYAEREKPNVIINDDETPVLSQIRALFYALQNEIYLNMFKLTSNMTPITSMIAIKPILINLTTKLLKQTAILDTDKISGFMKHVNIIYDAISRNDGNITDDIMKSFKSAALIIHTNAKRIDDATFDNCVNNLFKSS